MDMFDKLAAALGLWSFALIYALIFFDSKKLRKNMVIAAIVCAVLGTLTWIFS